MTEIETYAILGVALLALVMAIISSIQTKKVARRFEESVKYFDAKMQISQTVPMSVPKPPVPEYLKVQVDKSILENVQNLLNQIISELNKI